MGSLLNLTGIKMKNQHTHNWTQGHCLLDVRTCFYRCKHRVICGGDVKPKQWKACARHDWSVIDAALCECCNRFGIGSPPTRLYTCPWSLAALQSAAPLILEESVCQSDNATWGSVLLTWPLLSSCRWGERQLFEVNGRPWPRLLTHSLPPSLSG